MIVLALSTCFLGLPATAIAAGSSINLSSNVTSADTVGVKVTMGGFRYERCVPHISKGRLTVAAPVVDTSKKGGAKWSWLVPGNVGAGRWRFSVSCSGGLRRHRASKSFLVEAGIGRRAKGLWIPGSMHYEAVKVRTKSTGIGNGSGEGPLYPVGQCTWWVALRRPDLPLFSGKSGNALNWAQSAAKAGFPVGTVPAAAAVAVFQPGQYGAGRFGHVAYVTAVAGGKITISEANFRGRAGHDTRTIDSSGLQFIYRKGEMGPPPDVQLLAPQADASVHGAINLSAKSNFPAVRFEVFSYSNPAEQLSGNWVVIADDKDPSDGFSASWDTTTIPNQGGPGGSSVVVTAVALDGNSNPTEARSSARVNVANSRNEGGQTFYPYYVVGTCEDGQCGLHLRSGPGYSSYPIVGTKYDGEEIDIVCQSYGEAFTAPSGGSSSIWDQLTNGDWVIDYYVDTPGRGVPSPPLPPCP